MLRGIKAFKKDLNDFAKDVPRGGVKAIREEASNWFGEVVSLTPKLTNFASSNWKYTINTRPPNSNSLQKPKGGSFSPASTPSFYRLGGEDTMYMYNQTAYIPRLEDGYSAQAPSNFFKNSARRANRRLQTEFKKLNARSTK